MEYEQYEHQLDGTDEVQGQGARGPEVSRQTMMGPSSAAGRTSSLPVTREGSSSTHPAAQGRWFVCMPL